jgi:hypothetical protein
VNRQNSTLKRSLSATSAQGLNSSRESGDTLQLRVPSYRLVSLRLRGLVA